jgi:hypothetical protein
MCISSVPSLDVFQNNSKNLSTYIYSYFIPRKNIFIHALEWIFSSLRRDHHSRFFEPRKYFGNEFIFSGVEIIFSVDKKLGDRSIFSGNERIQ